MDTGSADDQKLGYNITGEGTFFVNESILGTAFKPSSPL